MASFESDGKAFFIILIGALVAIIFLATIADSVFTQTNELGHNNLTVTLGAANVTTDIQGRELVSRLSITNESLITVDIPDLTLQTGIGSNGLKTVQILNNDTAGVKGYFAGTEVNVSYTYIPDGYLNNGGARSVQALIVIMGAIAILVFVVVVLVKTGTLGKMMGRG